MQRKSKIKEKQNKQKKEKFNSATFSQFMKVTNRGNTFHTMYYILHIITSFTVAFEITFKIKQSYLTSTYPKK